MQCYPKCARNSRSGNTDRKVLLTTTETLLHTNSVCAFFTGNLWQWFGFDAAPAERTFCWFKRGTLGYLCSNPLHDDVKNRNERNRQQCGSEHAAEDNGAQRLLACSAGAGSCHERHHAQDKRDRSHHDRTKSPARRFHRCINGRHTLSFEFSCELHD